MAIYTFDSRDEAVQELDTNDALPDGTHVEMDHDSGKYVFIGPDGVKLTGAVSDVPAKREPREAQPGDMVYTSEPNIPSIVRALAQRAANNQKAPMVLRDAATGEVVEIVHPNAKAERGEKRTGPTDIQQAIIDLCSRPEGATSFELVDGVCRTGLLNAQIGKIAWKQLVEGCVKYGYTYNDEEARMVSAPTKKGTIVRKPASVYKLIEVTAANDDGAELSEAAD